MIGEIFLDAKLNYLESSLKSLLPEGYTLSDEKGSDTCLCIVTTPDVYFGENQIVIEKPIHIEQLLQHINNKMCNLKYTYKNIILYPIRKQLIYDEKVSYLTEMEVKLLLYFFKNHLTIADKTKLLKSIWKYSPDNVSNTVETHVKNLRHKLNELGIENALYIENGKCIFKV